MKKNFLKIAAMLIAAMLLVVSCSQEVAPKNDGFVSASVNIADTRSLSTTGEEYGNITYEYKLTPKFSQIEANSEIVGTKSTWTPIPENKQLGYVTQGLWTIEVQGSVKRTVEDTEYTYVVVSGSANHYFNNQNETAKVFVEPETGSGALNISVDMQDLDQKDNTKYEVRYALTAIDATSESDGTPMTRTPKDNNISSYSINVASVAAGYYRLTISVWGPTGGNSSATTKELLGGVTKSIRVLNGATVVVSGSVEPNDFDKSNVNFVIIQPKGIIGKDVASPVTKSNIKVTVTDTTDVKDLKDAGYTKKTNGIIEDTDGNVYAVSYIWDVNGAKITTQTEETNGSSITLNYEVPGPKSVSCAIVYKVKSFGETYTYVSAADDSLALSFVVSENTTPTTTD